MSLNLQWTILYIAVKCCSASGSSSETDIYLNLSNEEFTLLVWEEWRLCIDIFYIFTTLMHFLCEWTDKPLHPHQQCAHAHLHTAPHTHTHLSTAAGIHLWGNAACWKIIYLLYLIYQCNPVLLFSQQFRLFCVICKFFNAWMVCLALSLTLSASLLSSWRHSPVRHPG